MNDCASGYGMCPCSPYLRALQLRMNDCANGYETCPCILDLRSALRHFLIARHRDGHRASDGAK